MVKRSTCNCLQEAADNECEEVGFFYNVEDDEVSIECCFYNDTSDVQEEVELTWNFCPQCGKALEEVVPIG